MSEMTATRNGLSSRAATITVLAAVVWLVGAALLWRTTTVPDDLSLPKLDDRQYFSAAELTRTARYERVVRIDLVLSLLASIAALLFLVRRAPRLARDTGLGPIGAGVIVAMVMLIVLWAVGLPSAIILRAWDQHYGLTKGSWAPWLIELWAGLAGEVAFAMLAVAILMAFARRYPRHWWLPVMPVFLVFATVFLLVSPYLLALGVNPPTKPTLRADIQRLERVEHVEGTPIDVEKVSDTTTQANAFATGLGRTTRVVLYDTLLDKRFSRGEVRFVVAHEFGHIAHKHLWKGLGWTVLFAFPIAFLLAQVTRRRGGLGDPGVLPYGLLVLVLLQIPFTPVTNVVSRRFESEADWSALKATRDPASGRGLFQEFSKTSLQQPNPPTWAYLFFDTHPTTMQRIAMTEAWKREQR
jgi:Zn-dependent protease with chaperone function